MFNSWRADQDNVMKPKVKFMINTCLACPAQWEGGLEDGRMIYIRYRHSWLSVRVSELLSSDIMDAVRGVTLFDGYVDNPEFEEEDVKRFLREILQWD